MINVKIDNETALDMLYDRLRVWTSDDITLKLFDKMYQSYIDGGVFDGGV